MKVRPRPTKDDETQPVPCPNNCPPCVMVLRRILDLRLRFEIRGFYPLIDYERMKQSGRSARTYLEDEFSITFERRMFESFCYGHIRVLEICVLSNKSNSDLVKEALLPATQ